MGNEMPEILTIGYEGASLDDVLAALTGAGVHTLVDVRAVPVSRKPGFSKKALGAAVEAAGMAYVHLADLGCPKPGRDAAKAGRRLEFEQIFDAHMATPAAEKALTVAGLIAIAEGPACLICFEADPERCHRSIVAGRLAERHGIQVRHL